MIKAYYMNSTLAKYDDTDFAWLQTLLLNAGIIANQAGTLGLGVVQNATPGMSVQVPAGKALVQITKLTKTFKVVVDNDATVTCNIASNSTGSNRVDAIVVRVNVTTEPNILKSNVATIETVLGTGVSALSDGAITTALGSDGWYRLANVTVANGASSILNASIADTRARVTTSNAVTVKDNFIDTSVFATSKFGGTGADGALTITSGTTTLDCGGAAVFTKNYSSISITGTGKLAFSNPHANGTIIILRCSGNFTVTSSATPAIDVVGMGAAANTDGTTNIGLATKKGVAGTIGNPNPTDSTSSVGGIAPAVTSIMTPNIILVCGAGGSDGTARTNGWNGNYYGGGGGSAFTNNGSAGASGGSNSGGSAGSGGRGGGALYIQVKGAYNVTGIISAAGATGGASGNPGGGGGGGGGGSIVIRYNTLTTNSGTYTVSGGAGGSGIGGYAGTPNGGAGGNGYSDVALNQDWV